MIENIKNGNLYIIENAVIFTFAAKPKNSDERLNIFDSALSKIKNGLYIKTNSIIKKTEITFEINLNGFLICLTHMVRTKNAITIAKICDKTTKDSVLFMAKIADIEDHKKKQKNSIVTLLFNIFFNW